MDFYSKKKLLQRFAHCVFSKCGHWKLLDNSEEEALISSSVNDLTEIWAPQWTSVTIQLLR